MRIPAKLAAFAAEPWCACALSRAFAGNAAADPASGKLARPVRCRHSIPGGGNCDENREAERSVESGERSLSCCSPIAEALEKRLHRSCADGRDSVLLILPIAGERINQDFSGSGRTDDFAEAFFAT